MLITLQNEFLAINIQSLGAELTSVKERSSQLEYMWQADPAYWKRHAPILFPIVGQLKDNQYSFMGQSYTLSRHGFARDKEFDILEQSSTVIRFVLKDDESTRAHYPFPFELIVRYELNERSLVVSYEVENEFNEILPFSIGAHPAFRCPLSVEDQFSDYYIEFERKETLDRHLLINGIFDGSTERMLTDANILPLNYNYFEKDAIVFHYPESQFIILKSSKSGRSIRMDYPGFPYLGIWTKAHAPFICLEPWYGIADSNDVSGEITEKPGIQLLPNSTRFLATYIVTFE